MTVLDLPTRTVIRRVTLSKPARAIAVNPYAHQAFVAGESRVHVIGEDSRSVLRSMPAGLPFSVTTAAGPGRQLYVGELLTGELIRLSYSCGTPK